MRVIIELGPADLNRLADGDRLVYAGFSLVPDGHWLACTHIGGLIVLRGDDLAAVRDGQQIWATMRSGPQILIRARAS